MTSAEERGESWTVGRQEAAQALRVKPQAPVKPAPWERQQGLHFACNNELLKVWEKADMIRSLI